MVKAKPASVQKPFDRALIRTRRSRGRGSRGRKNNPANEFFLYKRCVDDVVERVLDVRKDFESTLILADPIIAQQITKRLGGKIGQVICADHTHDISGLNVICDEEALPFRPASFDLVISLLSLHGVNQVPETLLGIKKLLRPDGLFLGALFGGASLGELRRVLYEAEDQTYAQVSPRVSSMIRLDQAAALLSASGFAIPVADRDIIRVNYTALTTLYQDLRRMGDTNALTLRSKSPVSKRFFKRVSEIYHRDHGTDNGKLHVSFEFIWLSGWAPHPSQPKALKPGSAKLRLADALGVRESKL